MGSITNPPKLSKLNYLVWDNWPSANEIALKISIRPIDQGITLLNKLDGDFAASIINDNNISVDKAATIFDNTNLAVDKAASIFNSANLTVNKAVSIFDHANLSENRAEDIWHNANLGVTRKNSIGPLLSDLGKPLVFADEYTWKTKSSPYSGPSGIGGDNNIIWHCDYYLCWIWKLDTDFNEITDAGSPGTYPYGIGGDSNTIWHVDWDTEKVYELSTSDFSVVRSASSPGTDSLGIGGDSNTIWHCDQGTEKVYRLYAGS